MSIITDENDLILAKTVKSYIIDHGLPYVENCYSEELKQVLDKKLYNSEQLSEFNETHLNLIEDSVPDIIKQNGLEWTKIVYSNAIKRGLKKGVYRDDQFKQFNEVWLDDNAEYLIKEINKDSVGSICGLHIFDDVRNYEGSELEHLHKLKKIFFDKNAEQIAFMIEQNGVAYVRDYKSKAFQYAMEHPTFNVEYLMKLNKKWSKNKKKNIKSEKKELTKSKYSLTLGRNIFWYLK